MARTRIVVADDHKEMRDKVVQHLQHQFDVIGSVETGEAVLDADATMHPDLFVLDVSMPVLDGIEACRELQARGSNSKIVFLTVHEDPDFLEAALEVGALAYVVKSRMHSDLIPAIDAAMDSRVFISPVFPLANDLCLEAARHLLVMLRVTPAGRNI